MVLQQDSMFSKQTPQALSLFPWAEHHFSKPNVISQLEEVEDFWPVEREIPQDTCPGESQAWGSSPKGWAYGLFWD